MKARQQNIRSHYEEDFKKEAVRLIEKEGYSLGDPSFQLTPLPPF